MAVEALARIQPQQTYLGPEETTWRNRAFQIVAFIDIALGAGLFLAPFFTSLSLAISLVGAVITALSVCSLIYIRNIDSSQKLIKAAEAGNGCMVKFLLFLGANPNTDLQNSALKLASAGGYSTIVLDLLNAGANPNFVDRLWQTPLSEGIMHKRDEVVEILLENGADPNVRRLNGHGVMNSARIIQDYYRAYPENFDGIGFGDHRTSAERRIAVDRILEMLEAHNAQ